MSSLSFISTVAAVGLNTSLNYGNSKVLGISPKAGTIFSVAKTLSLPLITTVCAMGVLFATAIIRGDAIDKISPDYLPAPHVHAINLCGLIAASIASKLFTEKCGHPLKYSDVAILSVAEAIEVIVLLRILRK